jgi:hypothetical protein
VLAVVPRSGEKAMRYRVYLGLVILAAGIFGLAVSSNYAAQTSSSVQSENIKSLMKERRDILKKRASAFESHYINGFCTLERLIDARDDLLAAELELAESRENYIELLKSRLTNLKEGEQRILELQKVEARGICETDGLLATSRRLLAEIELERALAAD